MLHRPFPGRITIKEHLVKLLARVKGRRLEQDKRARKVYQSLSSGSFQNAQGTCRGECALLGHCPCIRIINQQQGGLQLLR